MREPPLSQQCAVVQTNAGEAEASFRVDRYRWFAVGPRLSDELREISAYNASVRFANCAYVKHFTMRIAAERKATAFIGGSPLRGEIN